MSNKDEHSGLPHTEREYQKQMNEMSGAMKTTKMVERMFYYCDECGDEVGNGFLTVTTQDGKEYHACAYGLKEGDPCKRAIEDRIEKDERESLNKIKSHLRKET